MKYVKLSKLRVQFAARKMGYNWSELARQLGRTRTTLRNWMTRPCSESNAEWLAKVLNTTVKKIARKR